MLKSSRIAILYTYQFITFVLFSVFVMPIAIFFRSQNKPWVISGHRGRIYDDNSAALHKYISQNTSQQIIWISTNQNITSQLEKSNCKVLTRNTLKSRLAIILAPVLVYSHGEDDLDLYLIFWRKILGKRIYLNHCLNHLKAGDCYRNDYQKASKISKTFKRFLMTDFDYFLASSESEKQKFTLSQPHKAKQIVLGGGAHLDYFWNKKNTPPASKTNSNQIKTIVYFPTFRDSAKANNQLKQIIKQIISDNEIINYLEKNNLVFQFHSHINSQKLTLNNIPKCFSFNTNSDVKEEIAKASLLISDYSSLFLDYLILDKPLLLFPFDLDEYLAKRRFYQDYSELDLGPVVKSFNELKGCLILDNWQNILKFGAKRKYWKDEIFPYREAIYSKKCYNMIVNLISN